MGRQRLPERWLRSERVDRIDDFARPEAAGMLAEAWVAAVSDWSMTCYISPNRINSRRVAIAWVEFRRSVSSAARPIDVNLEAIGVHLCHTHPSTLKSCGEAL